MKSVKHIGNVKPYYDCWTSFVIWSDDKKMIC